MIIPSGHVVDQRLSMVNKTTHQSSRKSVPGFGESTQKMEINQIKKPKPNNNSAAVSNKSQLNWQS